MLPHFPENNINWKISSSMIFQDAPNVNPTPKVTLLRWSAGWMHLVCLLQHNEWSKLILIHPLIFENTCIS